MTDQRCDDQIVLRFDGDLRPGKRPIVFRGNMGWASIEVAPDWQSPDVGCSVAGRSSASILPYLALALFLVIGRRHFPGMDLSGGKVSTDGLDTPRSRD